MKTAEFIVQLLEEEGVEYMFAIPGGASEDLNIALFNSKKIKVIVAKHEEGAAFMADGFARVSGRVGLCATTSGPGASNLITGLATSYGDGIPVCAFTGQVAISLFGKGAFQETGDEAVNIVNIFSNFTKYSCMMLSEERVQYIIHKALRMACSHPSGPVHISLPVDIMKRDASSRRLKIFRFEEASFNREGVKATAEKLVSAKRPVILAGWGVVLSRGAAELLELADQLNIPVATSPKAKGVFPETHPLSLGVLGFAGSPATREYILEQKPDILLAIGTSFNEFMTDGWDDRLNPTDGLIHIDVDPEKVGKNYLTTFGVIGDAKAVLTEVRYAVKRKLDSDEKIVQSFEDRRRKSESDVKNVKARHADKDETVQNTGNGLYHPRDLVKDIQKSFPEDTVYFAEIGNVLAWSIRYLSLDRPYSFFASLGFGTVGYASAASVGAKLALKDRPVVALVGDGSFLMNGFETAAAVNYDVPVVWIIFNNAMYGIIHHGRKMFEKPVPEGMLSTFKRVDFTKVAEGLGARAIKIKDPGQMTPDLAKDILDGGRPTVLDVWVDDTITPPIHSRIKSIDKRKKADSVSPSS